MGRQDAEPYQTGSANAGPHDQGHLAQRENLLHGHDGPPSLGKRKRSSDAPPSSTAPSPASAPVSAYRRQSAFDPIRDSAGNPPSGPPASTHMLPPLRGLGSFTAALAPETSPTGTRSAAEYGSPEPTGLDSRRRDQDMIVSPGHAAEQDVASATGSERKKRQFARRTKTGCLTCRKRKKKCDEARPVCENCARGKFTCGGYTDSRSNLDDPPKPQPHPPPQPQPQPQPQPSDGPTLRLSRSDPRLSIETSQSSTLGSRLQDYPHSVGYDRRASLPWQPYPEPPRSALEAYGRVHLPHTGRVDPNWTLPRWSTQGLPPPRPVSPSTNCATATVGHQGRQSERSIPTGELYQSREKKSGSASLPDEAALARNRVDSAKTISALSYPRGQSAASHIPTPRAKEKMVAGQPYPHFTDPVLRRDRATCALLLERFNEAAKTSEYSDDHERNGQLLAAVLAPMELQRGRHPVGSIGRRTVIEAPFHCDYGYNIHIGDDVVIQTGCVISDPCRISIGSRSIIGPNVKFYGMTLSSDPKLRNGGHSHAIGGPISIEEDCFIGGNVIIMANRTIKRGSVVGAGTVVSKDVQAGTIVAGSPMRVIRTLEETADDSIKQHIAHVQAEVNAIDVNSR